MSRLAGATCLAALLLAPPAPGAAAEQPTTATAVLEPAVIGVGELASFTITVTSGGFGGLDAQPAFELDNLEVVGAPSESRNQSWMYGKTSSKLQLTWRLRPKGVGPARVRSIALTVAGQALRLSDKEIEVRQEPPPRPQPAPGRPGAPGSRSFDPFEDLLRGSGLGRRRNPSAAEVARPKVYLRAELQPAAVYAGQQTTYTLWLYTQTDVGAYQPTRLPAFKGFWVREIPQPAELKPDWLEPNGERIARFAILRRALFPLQAGRFPIEAAEVDLVARMAEIGPFGTPFGRSETLHLKTEPMALEVLALPPAPPGFTGAVGDLTVSARLDRSTIAVGEAATLTIRSTGHGNLQSLRAPQLPIPDGIRIFPPRQESAERLTDGSLVSSQEWSYVLVAERPGSFELPALALPYFDPAKKAISPGVDPPAGARRHRGCGGGRGAPALRPPRAAPRRGHGARPGPALRQDLALGCGRGSPRRRPAGRGRPGTHSPDVTLARHRQAARLCPAGDRGLGHEDNAARDRSGDRRGAARPPGGALRDRARHAGLALARASDRREGRSGDGYGGRRAHPGAPLSALRPRAGRRRRASLRCPVAGAAPGPGPALGDCTAASALLLVSFARVLSDQSASA